MEKKRRFKTSFDKDRMVDKQKKKFNKKQFSTKRLKHVQFAVLRNSYFKVYNSQNS